MTEWACEEPHTKRPPAPLAPTLPTLPSHPLPNLHMRTTAVLAPVAAVLLAVAGTAYYFVSRDPAQPPEPPAAPGRLAVLVVFDQMRGDFADRWREHLSADGFERVRREGAWYSNCNYPYATTTTGPGHASLLTGAAPDVHGIVNNNWIEKGSGAYCAASARYELVPPIPVLPLEPKEKPPERLAGNPDFLLAETVADVLKADVPGAKVFGLSLKDRSAILTTGKKPDGAYWFYGAFGTSTYYTDRARPWVREFNDSKRADRWFGTDWTRLRDEAVYTRAVGADVVPGEGKGVGQGVAFPHPTTGGRARVSHAYYNAVSYSPFGNDLLLEFAKECVTRERLGTRGTTDLLVVSFSSNDLIGHTWGPDSHEALDVTLRSDLIVADLLAFLDKQVGKDRYMLAISADHGACPLPEVARAQKVAPDAARVDVNELTKALNEHMSAKYPAARGASGKAATWVQAPFPWLVLHEPSVKVSGKARAEIVTEVAEFVAKQPHVARALTRAEIEKPPAAGDPDLLQRVRKSYYAPRCGDVFVALKPYCIPSKKLDPGTTHGSPYHYDTHVPFWVIGDDIPAVVSDEPTTPQALARVFAKWLGVRPPKGASYEAPTALR